MELGIIGRGKMGFNMAERLRLAVHNLSAPVIHRVACPPPPLARTNNLTDRMFAVMRHEFGGHA